MNEFQRYLAEEIAVDHADGFVSRGEALRRLGLLGLSMTAASSLLAGFAREATAAPAAAPAPATVDAPAAAPVPTRAITFAGP
jgi:carboxymethylenebutenolidase